MKQRTGRHAVVGTLLALTVFASVGSAAGSSDGTQGKKVPHSGGLSDLPKPIPQAVDAISRATEDIRKGAGKAVSKGANSISIMGDGDKKK
jgi:hypothetical protein